MSGFGSEREASEGFENKLYTGVENFKVVAVCPTHDELKKIYGDRAKEPTYTSKDDEGNDQIRIDIMLNNAAEEGEVSIATRMSFFVTKKERMTKDGSKKQFINLYGQTAWLSDDATKSPNGDYELVGAKGTYVFKGDGARPAYDGEEQLISFIRNLLNLEGPDKAENINDARSQFSIENWNNIFSGNVAPLKAAIKSNNKVGILLGVKTANDGKLYQDTYNRQTLRQWAKASNSFDYLRRDVESAQQNGAYPNTDFGNMDYKLREFSGATPTNNAALERSNKPAFSVDDASVFGGDDDNPFT